jgi:hypothetical protein
VITTTYPPASFFRPKIIKCTKIFGGRESAPDPAEGAHDAPTDPPVGWGGGLDLPYTPDPIGASILVPDKCPKSKLLNLLFLGIDSNEPGYVVGIEATNCYPHI